MQAIKPEDWGRIYAYIWKETKNGTEDLKRLFEKDPALAVKQITKELGIDYYDCLFEVPDAPEFDDAQLEAIMKGTDTTSFQFFLRLTC